MSPVRLVLAADEAIGQRALRLALRSPHEVVAVTSPGSDDDRLRDAATSKGIPWFDNRELRTGAVAERLAPLRPDVLVNAHSMVKVSVEAIDCFAIGAWNLHPGPLPELAGMNAPSWAIFHRLDHHGVTLHAMTADYDDGAIAYEERFPIAPDATGLTLSVECASRGLGLIGQLLDQLATDPDFLPTRTQSGPHHRFHGAGQPDDGRVVWNRPAAEIDAYVRAADFRPFPSPWHPPVAEIGGRALHLIEVEVGEPTGGEEPGTVAGGEPLRVAAADRWIEIVESEATGGDIDGGETGPAEAGQSPGPGGRTTPEPGA